MRFVPGRPSSFAGNAFVGYEHNRLALGQSQAARKRAKRWHCSRSKPNAPSAPPSNRSRSLESPAVPTESSRRAGGCGRCHSSWRHAPIARRTPAAEATPSVRRSALRNSPPDPRFRHRPRWLALPPFGQGGDDVRLHQTSIRTCRRTTNERRLQPSPCDPSRTKHGTAALVDAVRGRFACYAARSAANATPPASPSVLNSRRPADRPGDGENACRVATEPRIRVPITGVPRGHPNADTQKKSGRAQPEPVRTAEKPVAADTPDRQLRPRVRGRGQRRRLGRGNGALKQKIRRVLDLHRDRMLNMRNHGAGKSCTR